MVVAINALKIAYMPVPKAACTSVKTALATIDPDVEIDPSAAALDVNVAHRIYQTRRFKFRQWKEYDDWWRFTVIRDPLQRLLSVCSDIVVGRKELVRSPNIRRQSVYPPDPDADFFFQNIVEYTRLASTVKHHVLPVKFFIGPKPLRFDNVYTIQDIPRLECQLSERSESDVKIPQINSSGNKIHLSDLAPETQTFLKAYLADEYKFLDEYFDNPFE